VYGFCPFKPISKRMHLEREEQTVFSRSTIIAFPPHTHTLDRIGERSFRRIALDRAKDRHAHAAIEAYADSCETDFPRLAMAPRGSRHHRPHPLTQCASTVLRVFGLAQSSAAGHSNYAHVAWKHVRAQLALNLLLPPGLPR